MSELDVEAVDSVDSTDEGDVDEGDVDGSDGIDAADGTIASTAGGLPTGVDAPEYVLYGGKGGVGKTTAAAATALASAADGTATLVVSTDPAHSLSDTLDVAVPAEPARVREDVPLYAAEIDADAAMDESVLGAFGGEGAGGEGSGDDGPGDASGAPFAGASEGGASFGDDAGPGAGAGNAGAAGAGPFGGGGGLGGLGEALGGLGPDGDSAAGMPGADEAAAMQTLLRYLDDPRFERVIVDTAPTGHTLRLLELPEFLDTMVGRLVQLRERMGGMMDSIAGLFGGGDGGEPRPDLDELRERIERLRAVLRDPARTDFRVVMVPEEMSVAESERLVDRLDDYGIPVSTIVVNRVMEPLAQVADLEAPDAPAIDPDWVVEPDLDDCDFCQRRWQVQQRALGRATELFRGRDVRRVPLLADEVRGEEALRVVAACLTA